MTVDPITGIPAGATDRYYDGGAHGFGPALPDGPDGECGCGASGAWSDTFGAFLCGHCHADALADGDRAYDALREDGHG